MPVSGVECPVSRGGRSALGTRPVSVGGDGVPGGPLPFRRGEGVWHRVAVLDGSRGLSVHGSQAKHQLRRVATPEDRAEPPAALDFRSAQPGFQAPGGIQASLRDAPRFGRSNRGLKVHGYLHGVATRRIPSGSLDTRPSGVAPTLDSNRQPTIRTDATDCACPDHRLAITIANGLWNVMRPGGLSPGLLSRARPNNLGSGGPLSRPLSRPLSN